MYIITYNCQYWTEFSDPVGHSDLQEKVYRDLWCITPRQRHKVWYCYKVRQLLYFLLAVKATHCWMSKSVCLLCLKGLFPEYSCTDCILAPLLRDACTWEGRECFLYSAFHETHVSQCVSETIREGDYSFRLVAGGGKLCSLTLTLG